MLFALASTGFGGSARFKISRQREAAAVEDHAKLFSFRARRDDPSRKVDVEFTLEGSIAFAGPVAQGLMFLRFCPRFATTS